jgi:hypothetical protein
MTNQLKNCLVIRSEFKIVKINNVILHQKYQQ